MATRIRGINVEIGGDTTKLSKALEGVNKDIKGTQSQLKDVERLLKLDPTNSELLSQKQRLLADAVTSTSDKLATLKRASEQAAQTKDNYDAWREKYDPIKQKIGETETKLNDLKFCSCFEVYYLIGILIAVFQNRHITLDRSFIYCQICIIEFDAVIFRLCAECVHSVLEQIAC